VEGEEPEQPVQHTVKAEKPPSITESESKLQVVETAEVEKVPEDVKRKLVERGRTYLIETRLRKLNKDYETLKTRQLVGEITEEELEERSEPIRLAEKEKHVERKKKLDELLLKGEIRETVYQKLVSEYDEKIRAAERKLAEGIRQMEDWLISLEAEKQELLDQQEILMAKMKIGDLPVKEYETKKKELENKIKDTDLACQFLEGVIERFKAVEKTS